MDEKKFCPYCGQRLTGREIYCGKCGKRINLLSEVSSPQVRRKSNFPIGLIGIILAVIIVCAFFFFLWTNTDQRRILGTWLQEDTDGTLTGYGLVFYDDGEVLDTHSSMKGEYELSDGQLRIDYEVGWAAESYVFDYEFSGDTLTLTWEEGDSQAVFVKDENNRS